MQTAKTRMRFQSGARVFCAGTAVAGDRKWFYYLYSHQNADCSLLAAPARPLWLQLHLTGETGKLERNLFAAHA